MQKLDNIQKLYDKLWKSLIRPKRYTYTEYDLGGSLLMLEDCYATRLDFQLENPLGEKFYMSVYFPCSEDEEVDKEIDFMVYCHTHQANRVEGLIIMDKLLKNRMGLVVFDFRANGFSSGKYITLGWLEALDVNTVCKFLKEEIKAKSISLWGRSMGASSIVFFMSSAYRNSMDEKLRKEGKTIDWFSPKLIDAVILDSPFPYLNKTIDHLVKSKVKKIPSWLITLTVKIIDRDIKRESGVSVFQLNPSDHIEHLKAPCFMLIGNEDELIDTQLYYDMYRKLGSKIKRINLFMGAHADERPEAVGDEVMGFIKHVLGLRKNYMTNKTMMMRNNNPNISRNYLNYKESQLHTNLNNNGNQIRLVYRDRDLLKQSKIRKNTKFAKQKKTEISEKYNFSIVPLNLVDEGNQFDPEQLKMDHLVDNQDNTFFDELFTDKDLEQHHLDFLEKYNVNNMTGFDDFFLDPISQTNINKRFTTLIKGRRDKDVIEEEEEAINNSFEISDKKIETGGELKEEEKREIRPNAVFVPEYRQKQEHMVIRAENQDVKEEESKVKKIPLSSFPKQDKDKETKDHVYPNNTQIDQPIKNTPIKKTYKATSFEDSQFNFGNRRYTAKNDNPKTDKKLNYRFIKRSRRDLNESMYKSNYDWNKQHTGTKFFYGNDRLGNGGNQITEETEYRQQRSKSSYFKDFFSNKNELVKSIVRLATPNKRFQNRKRSKIFD